MLDSIRSDPNFFGIDGKFSKTAFDGFLRQNGLSEAGYLDIRRQEEAREQLTETSRHQSVVPQAYDRAGAPLSARKRASSSSSPSMPTRWSRSPTPTRPSCKEYFEQNKRQFMTPAYRKIALLMLTRDAVKAKIPVTDDEVKAAYEADKDKFNTPEKRRVLQVAFPDKAAADKAYADLLESQELRRSRPEARLQGKRSRSWHAVAKKDMIDAKIAEAAFALKKDEVSKPVDGQFTTVILRVTDVTPGTTKTFDDVKADVKDKLADERADRANSRACTTRSTTSAPPARH